MTSQEQLRLKIVRREQILKLCVVLVMIAIGSVIILAVPGMLVAFLLAFVITYLFKPVVTTLERWGLNINLAILIPFLVFGVVVGSLSSVLAPKISEQASNLHQEFPKYMKGANSLLQKSTNQVERMLGSAFHFDVSEKTGHLVEDSFSNFLTNATDFITKFFSTLLLAPFFAFFMLRDGNGISRKLLTFVPNNLFEPALNLLYQINKQLGGFIRARLLEAAFVGAFVWLGLAIIGFPYGPILAVFAGVTNLIPYIGPVIGAVPGLLVALVNQDPPTTLAFLSIIYVGAQILDMLILVPFVVAKIIDLHPVTVVVVIIIGAQLMGVMGMIISVPVASIIKLAFTEFYNHVVDFRG